MITDRSFANMFARTKGAFQQATPVHTERWQGGDISKRPDMVSYELLNWNCNISLECTEPESLSHWQDQLKPNLPWADDHFLERVGGAPLNPGVQWANWPWATSAAKHQDQGEFNHTYMERLWPKWAGISQYPHPFMNGQPIPPHEGIRYEYGDLKDLVDMLAHEPLTRQAWIPLFFPEDTGLGDGGRKPCTLGYQFIMRDYRLSIYYPLRSCDFVRHFRDDIYMAIRLLLWVLDRCREINPTVWNDVTLGYYAMHATSLHIFKNDYISMFGGK